MRFMSTTALQALVFSPIEVVFQYRSVIWMGAFLDDDACTFLRRQAAYIGKTLI